LTPASQTGGSKTDGSRAAPQVYMLSPVLLSRAKRVFGVDLSSVEVVVDAMLAARGKRGVAEGGKTIRLAPDAANDKKVIWHEMPHIVQQTGGNSDKQQTSNEKVLEAEAETGAEAAEAEETVAVGGAGTQAPLFSDGEDHASESGPVELRFSDDDITLESGYNEVDGESRAVGVEPQAMKIGVYVDVPADVLEKAHLEIHAGAYEASSYTIAQRGKRTVVYIRISPEAPYKNLRMQISGLSPGDAERLRKDEQTDTPVASAKPSATDTSVTSSGVAAPSEQGSTNSPSSDAPATDRGTLERRESDRDGSVRETSGSSSDST